MSKKPYKSLLGNRIYLELPKKDESKITNAVVIPNLGLDVDIILISPFDVIHVW